MVKDSFSQPSINDPWTMYTIDGCCFCKMALEFFEHRGLKIINGLEEKNIKDYPSTEYYVRVYKIKDEEKKVFLQSIFLNNYKTFPIIFEKDKLFGGLDRLIEDFSNPQ